MRTGVRYGFLMRPERDLVEAAGGACRAVLAWPVIGRLQDSHAVFGDRRLSSDGGLLVRRRDWGRFVQLDYPKMLEEFEDRVISTSLSSKIRSQNEPPTTTVGNSVGQGSARDHG